MAHVVVFAGEYDLADKRGLRRAMRRLDASDDLVLDMTEVTYIDSTFIAELIILEKARRAKKFGHLKVITPAKSIVRRIFEVTGMITVLEVVESYDGDGAIPNSVVEFAATGDFLDSTSGAKPADRIR